MKINATWELEPKTSIKSYVFSIIDSKIVYIEQKTRRFFDEFQAKFTSKPSSSLGNETNETKIAATESENAFQHIEELSRSIYVLERMKFSLNEENALEIMSLLNDDKYMNINDLQINSLLEVRSAA